MSCGRAEVRRAVPDDADPQIVELFDRYLDVFADASRRFGNLFPYNHLRLRIQALLAGRSARVLVREPTGAALVSFDIEWRDGRFQRVASDGTPAFSWVLDLATLEEAATTPWVYLAHPRRLGMAWFDTDDGAGSTRQPTTD